MKDILKLFLIHSKYVVKPFSYLPITFVKRIIFGRDSFLKQYFWDKWGVLNKSIKSVLNNSDKTLWIDGASGGEILQLVTFLQKIKTRHPDLKIVFSTASDDAYRFAKGLKTIDFVFNTPWDFAFVAKRVIRQILPILFMSVEFTRIPLHFKVAQRTGITTVLLSGLMSCDFQQHPTLTRPFALEYYKYFDFIGAKEERDRKCFLQLGVDEDHVRVMGNMKFDLENLKFPVEDLKRLCSVFQIKPQDKIFLAASVFPPEEKIAIDAYVQAKKKMPNLRMIIVPRFNKYIKKIKEHLKQHDLDCVLRSELPQLALNGKAVVVNSFGELIRIYHLSDYIFLSGSIFPVNKIGGGKNIVEPLMSGKPIFFGPFMNYWREIVSELKSVYKKCEVKNASDLAQGIVDLDTNQQIQERLLKKSKEILRQRSHIIEDNVRFIENVLSNYSR